MPVSVQIDPPRMGVDLDRNLALGASAQHLLDVGLVAWAALKMRPSNAVPNRKKRIHVKHDSHGLHLRLR